LDRALNFHFVKMQRPNRWYTIKSPKSWEIHFNQELTDPARWSRFDSVLHLKRALKAWLNAPMTRAERKSKVENVCDGRRKATPNKKAAMSVNFFEEWTHW